jgi:hypothetical protein
MRRSGIKAWPLSTNPVKTTQKLLLSIAVLASLSIVVIVLVRWKFTTYAKLDAGNGFQIHVIADTLWHVDPVRAYYYEVHHGPATVVDPCYIGAWPANVSFELRTTKDRILSALVERSNPGVVLALYDISSGETWPQCGDSEDFRNVNERGRSLTARLQDSHRDDTLILSIER